MTTKLSKYTYDPRLWEDAGRTVGRLNNPPDHVTTRAQAENYFREVIADEIFRHRKEPQGEERFPQGGLFWARALASSPRVKGWAQRYRQSAFQQTDPPFASLTEARAWLRKHKPASERAEVQDKKQMDRDEWTRWADAMPEHPPGMPVVIRNEFLRVDFPDEDGLLGTMYAHTAQLAAVARGAEYISETTGWHRAFSTVYVLTGEFPVNACGPLTWHSGGGIPWLEVKLYPGALNASTFRHLLRLARARVAKHLAEPPNGADGDLLDIIQEIGWWPPKGRGHGARVGLTQYWATLAERWNKLHANNKLTADALRKRWERMKPDIKKLGEQTTQHSRTKGGRDGKTR